MVKNDALTKFFGPRASWPGVPFLLVGNLFKDLLPRLGGVAPAETRSACLLLNNEQRPIGGLLDRAQVENLFVGVCDRVKWSPSLKTRRIDVFACVETRRNIDCSRVNEFNLLANIGPSVNVGGLPWSCILRVLSFRFCHT